MTERLFNLLTEPLIRTAPIGKLSLPGVMAALARDEVEGFPALRPHQGMFWHMFLVQLGALALHRAGIAASPVGEVEWAILLRGLTTDFPDDAPWHLVETDWSKPAFLQPPVPRGLKLESPVPTPDALDLLITSKNHDLKQAIAHEGEPEDWVFALISLQTGEGFGGAGNYGIARMNGGSSSRALLALAPRSDKMLREMAPRLGAWFVRDIRAMQEYRAVGSTVEYQQTGGLGLVWLTPWEDGDQLNLVDLDQWFIEICRRIRLNTQDARLTALRGTSKAARINAKHMNGALGDPWAPVHKLDNKSFTLGETGDFDYRTVIALMLSGDWEVPLLARPACFETTHSSSILIAMALARGNSKTGGFRSRLIPITGKLSHSLGPRRAELHEVAKSQVKAVADFAKALSYALVLAVAGGGKDQIKREYYELARDAVSQFDRFADAIFFDHLWRRFEARDEGEDRAEAEEVAFSRRLWERAREIFEQALPAVPCPSLFRPRAEAKARAALKASVRKNYPEVFEKDAKEEEMSDVG